MLSIILLDESLAETIATHNDNIDTRYMEMLNKINVEMQDQKDGEWEKFKLHHAARTFNYQFYSSVMIFFLVFAIIVFSLVICWLQFRKDIYIQTADKKINVISIGKDGLKVESPFVGLCVLAMSLCFLYMYLKEIYPIEKISL